MAIFPVISDEIIAKFNEKCETNGLKPEVPELCGHNGLACRQRNLEQGANRALCFGCALKTFAEEEQTAQKEER